MKYFIIKLKFFNLNALSSTFTMLRLFSSYNENDGQFVHIFYIIQSIYLNKFTFKSYLSNSLLN